MPVEITRDEADWNACKLCFATKTMVTCAGGCGAAVARCDCLARRRTLERWTRHQGRCDACWTIPSPGETG